MRRRNGGGVAGEFLSRVTLSPALLPPITSRGIPPTVTTIYTRRGRVLDAAVSPTRHQRPKVSTRSDPVDGRAEERLTADARGVGSRINDKNKIRHGVACACALVLEGRSRTAVRVNTSRARRRRARLWRPRRVHWPELPVPRGWQRCGPVRQHTRTRARSVRRACATPVPGLSRSAVVRRSRARRHSLRLRLFIALAVRVRVTDTVYVCNCVERTRGLRSFTFSFRVYSIRCMCRWRRILLVCPHVLRCLSECSVNSRYHFFFFCCIIFYIFPITVYKYCSFMEFCRVLLAESTTNRSDTSTSITVVTLGY